MSHWSDQGERGNLFWLSALSFSATVLGRGFLRLLCAPIALFFLLTAREARSESRRFLRKARPNVIPRWWHIFKHFYQFARVSSDRLLFLSGKSDRFDLDIQGQEIILQHARNGQGCILLVSHLGSFDAMRVPAVEQDGIHVRILIDKQHNPAAIQVVEQLNPEMAADMIDSAVPSSSLALELSEALESGQMVGIMADRATVGESTTAIEFMGGNAMLPSSPWMLAIALKVPVILCFAIYLGGNRYQIRFHQVSDGGKVDRGQRGEHLQQNMTQYAQYLERYAREYPYNWFNFYDFWSDASPDNQ